VNGPAEPEPETLSRTQVGFLVGNRFVPDTAYSAQLQGDWASRFQQVYLLEEGLERFSRIEVGQQIPKGPLIYKGQAFPLGPEEEVLTAFLDNKESIDDIKDVIPSLQAAFDLERTQRRRAEERRLELARRRQEAEERRILEEAQRAEEERRQELIASLGSGAGRREMAHYDFHSAAEAALAVGGATLLDVRDGLGQEKVVRYRLDGRRFECICDQQMRIIDAGVCLTDEQTGEKGDAYFTLESLPAVIRQAEREGVLVVYRHI
jgi:hypothetical protein